MNESINIEQGEQRVTAADLHRITGFSKAHISNLKKAGKLIFSVDADNRERINLDDALKQFEGSRDYNRDAQRQWADTQRKGRALNLPNIQGQPAAGVIDPANPHNLQNGPAFIVEFGNIKCEDRDIGKETQRSKLMRETFEAQLAEMEYREKCGELINMQGVEEANRRIAGSIRSKFLGLPTKVAARCEGKTAAEIQYIIEDEVNSIFSELYQLGGGAEEE
jgi:hypothetical protein